MSESAVSLTAPNAILSLCRRAWGWLRRHGMVIFWWVFAAEYLGLGILLWPDYFNLRAYVGLAGDQGSELASAYLWAHGLRPEINFRYPYGLFPLWLEKVLFGHFGYLPVVYALASVLVAALAFWAIARLLCTLSPPAAGYILVLLLMPLFFHSYLLILHYGLEITFLLVAMDAQLRGKWSIALAAAGMAVLCKPALGYVYGAVLLVVLIWHGWRSSHGFRALYGKLILPGLLGLLWALGFSWIFGMGSLGYTLFPIHGMQDYAATSRFGFDQYAVMLLHPPGVNWHFYVGTYTLFYALGGILTLGCGGIMWRLWGRLDSGGIGWLGALVFLELVNLFVLDWRYSVLIGLLGAITFMKYSRQGARVGAVCCLLMLTPALYFVGAKIQNNMQLRPVPGSRGLVAGPREMRTWRRVIRAAGRPLGRTVMLGRTGSGGLLFPGIEPPVYAYIPGACVLAGDRRRLDRQVRAAASVIEWLSYNNGSMHLLAGCPRLRSELQSDALRYQGVNALVWVRK